MVTFYSCLRFARSKCPDLFYINIIPLSNHAHWTFNPPLSYVPGVLDLVTNLGDAKVCSNADLALDIA